MSNILSDQLFWLILFMIVIIPNTCAWYVGRQSGKGKPKQLDEIKDGSEWLILFYETGYVLMQKKNSVRLVYFERGEAILSNFPHQMNRTYTIGKKRINGVATLTFTLLY